MKYEKRSTILLTACAVAAWITVFFGMRAIRGGGGVEGLLIPAAAATAIAVGLAFIWHIALDVIPSLKSNGWRTAGMSFIGVVGLIAVAASTWLMAAALSGHAAVRMDLSDQQDTFRKSLAQTYANGQLDQQLMPSLTRTAAEFRGMADLEMRNGTYSGRAGPGPAVDTFLRAAATFQRVANEGKESLERIETLNGEANEPLKKMGELIAGSLGNAEREKQFAQATAALQQILTEMAAVSFLPSVRALGVVNVTATASAGSAAAIKEVHAALEERTQKIHVEADKLVKMKKPVDPISFHPLGPGEAVVVYADRVMSGWFVAAAIDILPLLLIVLAFIRVRGTPGDEKHGVSAEWPDRSSGEGSSGSTADGSTKRPQLVPAE